jgi:hypothetical protein
MGIHNLQTLECAGCSFDDDAIHALFPPISFAEEFEEEAESSLPQVADTQPHK